MVHCSNKWDLDALHTAILKSAGYVVTQSTTRTESGKSKIQATLGAKIFGLGAHVGAEETNESDQATTTVPLLLDASDVNDIIAALTGFTRFIVLEDFHYLPIETQRDFSVALKAFHEQSRLCFIIVGVWLEESRLTVYNGDLTGRIFAINADKWSRDELRQVVREGEALLNVSFTESFVNQLLSNCLDSVYIVQESCCQACVQSGVYKDVRTDVGGDVQVLRIIKDVVNQQNGRYKSFITQFASGFQDTALQMYKWLLYPVLVSDTKHLEQGLRYREMKEIIRTRHPEGIGLNLGNLTQALQSTASLQVKKEIKPIVLDYDQTNLCLNVVDRGFLIWLDNQDRKELLEGAGLPVS